MRSAGRCGKAAGWVLGAFLLTCSVWSAPARASVSFDVAAEDADGTAALQAGSHPYSLQLDAAIEEEGDPGFRALTIHLPPGLLVNPIQITECSAAAFETPRTSPYEVSESGESCPNSSQVGVIAVDAGGTVRYFGLFNLASEAGIVNRLGAAPFGVPLPASR